MANSRTSNWRAPVRDLIAKYSEVGTVLKGARAKEGITQAELARKLRLSPSTVSRMESGTRPITAADALRLSKILRISERVFR